MANRALLRWTERRMPALARAVATPAVAGATGERIDAGTRWTPRAGASADGSAAPAVRAQVLYLTGSPPTSRWLAGSLAVRLGATVLVADHPDAAQHLVAELLASAAVPLAVVGEGAGCGAAVSAARAGAQRLALVSPPPIDATAASGWPTTLIQAPASGADRAAVVALDTALRRAGVAVRETEYADIEPDWARYPRISRGSKRALDDLVAFLDRGIGEASTFDVIPGWELH